MVQLNTPSIFGAWQQGENAAFQQKQRQLQLLQFEQEQQAQQAAAQREAQLREAITSGVDPSTPQGLGQLLRAGLPTDDYFKALDTQSQINLANIKGQTAQQTADAATTRAKAAEKNAETSAWQARQEISLKRQEEMRLIQEFKQNTDKTEFEAASNFAQIIAGVPKEQRPGVYSKLQSQYGDLFPRLFKGEYTPEVDVIVQALAKPQGKGGTVTMPDGTVIESGNFNETQKLRQEYLGKSQNFTEVRDSFSRLQAVAADPSAAGDISIIFSYMKMLDPGSVVREGEQATARNAAGIPDRIRNLYNKTLTGESLNSNQRQDFLNQGLRLYNKALEQQQKSSSFYKDIAKRSGLNPDLAVPDLGLAQPTPANGGQGGGLLKPSGQSAEGKPTFTYGY